MVNRRTWLIIVSGFFEPLFYLLSIRIGFGAARRRRHRRRPDDPVRRVRRPGADGGVGDERRGLRDDDERLLQDQARQALRRRAVDADDAGRRRPRRDRLGRDPRLHLLDRLPRHDVGARHDRPRRGSCCRCRSACSSGSPSGRWGWPSRRTCGRGPTSSTSRRSRSRCSCSRRRSTPCRATATGRWVVQLSPLYHGVALVRAANLGVFEWSMLGHVAVLAGLAVTGIVVASRRVQTLLLT